MENPFSSLEVQLIRSSLNTKTNEQLSELLERPVDEVVAKIDEITGGAAEQREQDVKLAIEEIALEKKKKAALKKPTLKPKKEFKEKQSERDGKRRKAEAAWEAQRKMTQDRDDRRKFKTRVRDYSKCTQVKLDDKTVVYVEPQATQELTNQLIDQIRADYIMRKNKNLYQKE